MNIMNAKDESAEEPTTQVILSISKNVPRGPNHRYEKQGKQGHESKCQICMTQLASKG